MNIKHSLWLLVLLSSSVMAETLMIKEFHDREHAFVFKSDGSMVKLKELNLETGNGFEIIGKEGGKYVFKGSDGEQYRVFIPEVMTNQTAAIEIPCDRPQILLASDHRNASARGLGEDCE